MGKREYTKACVFAAGLGIALIIVSPAEAEVIIQQEKMSFETCLKVIETSESKLAITSETSEKSVQKARGNLQTN